MARVQFFKDCEFGSMQTIYAQLHMSSVQAARLWATSFGKLMEAENLHYFHAAPNPTSSGNINGIPKDVIIELPPIFKLQ